jgi:hypothetical protein
MCAGMVSSGVVPLYRRLLMRTPSTSQRISLVLRSLERCGDVVERSGLRSEEQTGDERLEGLSHVVVPAVLDLGGRDRLRAHAAALDDLWQFFFQPRRDDAHGLDDTGDFQHDRQWCHGRSH